VAPLSLDQPIGDDGTMLDPGVDDAGFRRVEERQTLTMALARLPERDRQVLRWRFEEELTQSQIAARLAVSQMCVSRLLTRILRRLRTHLIDSQNAPQAITVPGREPSSSCEFAMERSA
jgi:RNA polymerase sigma-B factor